MMQTIIRGGLVAAAACLTACVSATQLEQASVEEFAKMRKEMTVATDPADRAFVTCVTDALIGALEPPYRSYDWEVEIFEDEAINAFAMPGGKIGVFTGLFKTARTQDQLAAVLGHEIAHVTSGHSLKRANSQAATSIGILAGSVLSETVRDNAGLVVLGAQLGLLLPYGRAQESEADVLGLEYMAQAGFDPEGAVELWQNMAEESPSKLPEFLSTHPSSDSRIRDLRARIETVEGTYQAARATGKRPGCSR